MTIEQLLHSSLLSTTEAQILLSFVLNLDRSYLFAHSKDVLNTKTIEKFKAFEVRRLNKEPLQYITNKQQFYGLEFYVDQSVLIPRPETEELVDKVLKFAQNLSKNSHFLDVGTGSGNIIISLAKNLGQVRLTATDISPASLEIAKSNAKKHHVENKIEFVQGNLLEPFMEKEKFDVIVANLPYISEPMYQVLEPHIKEYEPKLALVGGATGVELYNQLFDQAKSVLTSNGVIFYELDGRVYSTVGLS